MSRKKPIEIDVYDHYEVFPDGVFEAKVVPSGNGAAIPFYKKFLGDEVVVIVKDRIIESKKKERTKKMVAVYDNDKDITLA